MLKPKRYLLRHNDGTIWAKGWMLGKKPHGGWTWFRKTGTRMRSGSFDNGKQVGRWTTYDRKGQPFKVTRFG